MSLHDMVLRCVQLWQFKGIIRLFQNFWVIHWKRLTRSANGRSDVFRLKIASLANARPSKLIHLPAILPAISSHALPQVWDMFNLAPVYLKWIPAEDWLLSSRSGCSDWQRPKFHSHAHDVAQKAGSLAQNLLRSTVCLSPDFMVTLFTLHVCPIIDYFSSLWIVGCIQGGAA